jgi:hypothetical protein
MQQVAIGAVLLLAGTAVILGVSAGVVPGIPALIGSAAMLAMAAGALLVGSSGESGRPV